MILNFKSAFKLFVSRSLMIFQPCYKLFLGVVQNALISDCDTFLQRAVPSVLTLQVCWLGSELISI